MSDTTRIQDILQAQGPQASEELLPFVYRELKRMAATQMAQEAPGHTLQPTALVHEAWLRLAGPHPQRWENRAHFFGAAAEAMRRILIDHARRKRSLKRGGGGAPVALAESDLRVVPLPDELLAVHEALDLLAQQDRQAAELVKLRYFVGLSMEEAASVLGLPKRTAESLWTYARTWLHRQIR